MWNQLEKKLVQWFNLVLGNTKYADHAKLYEHLVDPAIWKELLAALDSSVKITGKSNEEQFTDILKNVSQSFPVTNIIKEDRGCLLELLLRIVWKYQVLKIDTLKGPLLAWTQELIDWFPCANIKSWPVSIHADEQLGPLFEPKEIAAALSKKPNVVLESIREDAVRIYRGGYGTKLDEGLKRRILTGSTTPDDVKTVIKLGQRKLVRLFTSSTFTDTELERNILMAEAYPFLRSICQIFGYGYEVVDMRWGVREFSGGSHATGELCIGELHKCLSRSTGPAFITFLGDKYGFRPFPKFIEPKVLEKLWDNMKAAQIDQAEAKLKGNTAIPADLFQNLRKAPLESVWRTIETAKVAQLFVDNELLLVPMWFRLDANHVPPIYTLQNVWTVLPDLSGPEKGLPKKWWSMFEAIQASFRSNLAGLSKEEQTPFIISITEEEVRTGILNNPNFKDQSFCVLRKIGDLTTFSQSDHFAKFIDFPNKEVDEEAVKLLQALKKEVAAAVHPARSITYDVKGNQVGLTPDAKDTSPTQEYLNKFRDDFTKLIGTNILESIKKSWVAAEPYVEEVIQHHILQEGKAKAFFERPAVMDPIYAYLSKPAKYPLIISGESGSGKTFCVAGAVQKALAKSKDANVVYRFLGTTPNSSNLRSLLQHLCQQLAFIAGANFVVSSSIQELSIIFPSLLAKAAAVKPLVVLLDSLDQLSGEGASNFDWIPRGDLPPNVFLVLSVYSEVLPSLTNALPNHSLVKIPRLAKDEGAGILDKWLTTSKRALTPAQRDLILTKFQTCPLPLFLKLCFDISSRWNSYTPLAECVLSGDIQGLINQIFERLELIHGKILLSVSLGCITAAKEGLSYPELEDVLACSEQVLESTYQWWIPPLRRFPPLIWLRVNDELNGYLVERSSGSSAVYGWYHRQFVEAAKKRYLANQEIKQEYHRLMAGYFGGFFENVPKPFISKGALSEALRYTQPQPLSFNQQTYNIRKLVELPHHQSQSGLTRRYEDTLFNFEFIHAKCAAGLLYGLISDYEEALAAHGAADKALAGKLVEFVTFIKQNLAPLAEHPTSAIQIAAFQSSTLFPTQQALSQKQAPVVVWRNKKDSDNPVRITLPHDATVTAAAITKDAAKIATVDYGNKNIRIWEVASGKLLASLQGHNFTVSQLHFLSDSRTLLSFSVDRKLSVWDIATLTLKKIFDGVVNPRWSSKLDATFKFIVSADEKFVASGYGNSVEVWDLQKLSQVTKFDVDSRGSEDTDVQIHFLPKDSSTIVTAFYDEPSSFSSLGIWSIQGAKSKEVKLAFGERIIWSALNQTGDSLLVATAAGNFEKWSSFSKLESSSPTPEFTAWTKELVGTKQEEVSHDGKLLLLKDENQLVVLDKVINDRVKASSSLSYKILRGTFSPKGEKAALICSDNVLRVINGKTGVQAFSVPVETKEICYPHAAFVNEDVVKVIVGLKDSISVLSLNAATGKEAGAAVSLKLQKSPDSVKLSSTGSFAAAAVKNGDKYEVNVYTASDLKVKHTFSSPNDKFSVTFSEDDKAFAYAQGANVQVFSTQTFACTQTFIPDYPLSGFYALSNDLKHFVMLHNYDLLIYNLSDGSKSSTKTTIVDYHFFFTKSGDYIVHYQYGAKGADVISRTFGTIVRHVRFDRGIDTLFVSGSSALCEDKEGKLFLLDVDF